MTSLPRFTTRFGAVALAAIAATAVVACSPVEELTNPDASTATPEPSTAPVAQTIAPEDVTCENMLSAETVDTFESTGWTVREDPFVILDLELPDGTACTWGAFGSPTNDDLVLFGWSPITAADATATQAALEAEGWLREDVSGGVMITEDPTLALRLDDEGYGMTYLFGDGWVEVSDTRQGLDLIDLG